MLKVVTTLLIALLFAGAHSYKIGVGIADITGPTGIGFYGYAKDSQIGNGLYFRLYSRAYIIEENKKRVVYVNTDLWSAQESVKTGVIKELKKVFGKTYTYENFCLSSTHQHSGPGGYGFGALYNIATAGFSSVNYKIIVKGIVQSIVNAHKNMVPGKIYFNEGKLQGANINRSPSSYEKNPKAERDSYPDGNQDKTMSVLKFVDMKNKPLGAIAWFAVHPTSLSSENKLISGDNKGYASYLFEKKINMKVYNKYAPGHSKFIASFPEAPSGDSSANTRGAFCPNNSRCEYTAQCRGKAKMCLGRGPTDNRMKNLRIIGKKQADKAHELFVKATTRVQGSIDFIHNFVKMSTLKIDKKYMPNHKKGELCRPAFGPAFFGGTSDGASGMNAIQGKQNSAPILRLISAAITAPTKKQIQCQKPKKAAMNLDNKAPYEWIPEYTPLQIFKIGQIVIVSVSTELTTMAARRLSKNLKKTLIKEKVINNDGNVILNTVANGYTHYTTTPEEYTAFRYEGASTIFGKYQLNAYHQEFDNLIHLMVKNKKPKVLSYQLQVETKNIHKYSTHDGPTVAKKVVQKVKDVAKHVGRFFHNVARNVIGKKALKFGDVKGKANSSYKVGDTVKVRFHGRFLKHGWDKLPTLMQVEHKVGSHWKIIKNDANIETKIYEKFKLAELSIVTEWTISSDVVPGVYRIKYFGWNDGDRFTGISNEFKVTKK